MVERKMVKSKYEKDRICKRVERLVVDGNEFPQFHGAAITCSLGINGLSTICKKKCCQVCSIIASGFDTGDRTISSSTKVGRHMRRRPRNVLRKESARKAIVVCGVIAGRIAHYHAHGLMDEEDGEFDSAMEWGGAI
ncbi:hypothetical protein L3X38_024105 [Prunus dulcis]|uniref:Uncharacterized protein n=1 Tax=Prunus dulcis TaxID=3755 RepID=A0AAD4W138_PRUDU|nr:hypothetical protein L3X38_024105 [Prunus dulcis]